MTKTIRCKTKTQMVKSGQTRNEGYWHQGNSRERLPRAVKLERLLRPPTTVIPGYLFLIFIASQPFGIAIQQ